MTDQQLDATSTQIQAILDRDYPHLEWRVLLHPPDLGRAPDARGIVVHARTRDFRYRCHVARPWTAIVAAPPLRFLVAELAAEADRLLAAQRAAAP